MTTHGFWPGDVVKWESGRKPLGTVAHTFCTCTKLDRSANRRTQAYVVIERPTGQLIVARCEGLVRVEPGQ